MLLHHLLRVMGGQSIGLEHKEHSQVDFAQDEVKFYLFEFVKITLSW